MNAKDVYRTIQSRPHGSSGRGMSHWITAAACGRKANLQEQHREKMDLIRAQEAKEDDGNDALSIGVYYHALMEMGLRGQLGTETWDQTDTALDANFLEAVRLYRGYRRAWGSPLDRWAAELIGVEVVLGEGERTGRADAVFNVLDPGKAYENTGLLLPSPGIYIVDWKTGGAISDRDQWDFGFGVQSINYITLAKRMHPEWNIQGMIFDKIIRHKFLRKEVIPSGANRGGASFYAYLAKYQDGDEKIVDQLVSIGSRNTTLNLANPAACFSGAKPCPMFTLGLCERK